MQVIMMFFAITLAAQLTENPATEAPASETAGAAATDTASAEEAAVDASTEMNSSEDSAAAVPEQADAPAGQTPTELLAALVTTLPENRLAGRGSSLLDALQGATTRTEQTARTEAYWDLFAATADYYLAMREAVEFATLRAGVRQPGPQWAEYGKGLEDRLQLARRKAVAAQYQLGERLDKSASSKLPLPEDAPHTGPYLSRYEEIFQGGDHPAAKNLHHLLSLEYQRLENGAEAVAASGDRLNQVSQQRSPTSNGSELLQAYQQLCQQRRDFVDSVRSYNQTIVRYTELALPEFIESRRLAAMLIRTGDHASRSNRTGTDNNASDIRRTNAEEPVNEPVNTESGSHPRTTYAEQPAEQANAGDRTDSNFYWKPTRNAAEQPRQGERSIVVKRDQR